MSQVEMGESERAEMIIKALGFELKEDHVFSSDDKGKEVRKMMRDESKGKSKGNKLVQEDEPCFKLIPTEKGFGLAAATDLRKNKAIMMYYGKVTLQEDIDVHSEYVLQVPGTKYYIDSKHEGNFARFINHSCDPNCGIGTDWYNGKCYPVVYSKKPIPQGTELTYDYDYHVSKGAKNIVCKCGASEKKCRYMFAKEVVNDLNCGLRYSNVDGKLKLDEEPCNHQCKTNIQMFDHRFSKHYAGGVLTCVFCKRDYKTYGSLKTHGNKKHKDKIRANWMNESIRYPCSYCNEWDNRSPTQWQDHLLKCEAKENLSDAVDLSTKKQLEIISNVDDVMEDSEDEGKELDTGEDNAAMEEECTSEEDKNEGTEESESGEEEILEDEEDEEDEGTEESDGGKEDNLDEETDSDDIDEEGDDENDKSDMDWEPANSG